MTFGQRIKSLRVARGWTQADVCRRTKLSGGFYSDVENGKRDVSAATLARLAREFGVSMDAVYAGLEAAPHGDHVGGRGGSMLDRMKAKRTVRRCQSKM